jgi:molecular chaperone HtpG
MYLVLDYKQMRRKKISNTVAQEIHSQKTVKIEKKWNDIKIVLEYGMLSEDKFYEKSAYPTVDDKFYT